MPHLLYPSSPYPPGRRFLLPFTQATALSFPGVAYGFPSPHLCILVVDQWPAWEVLYEPVSITIDMMTSAVTIRLP
jgi:hypothetical protein